MNRIKTCPNCGAAVPAGTMEGLCPKCLVRRMVGEARGMMPLRGAASDREGDSVTGSGGASPGGLAPPRWFGDYELLEELGRGGMGVVFKARQASLDRIVAVKMMLFGRFAGREFQERFRVEAKAAANLRHPNLVTVHEVGEQEGFQFFTMDYIEGRNLADVVRERPLLPRRAARYVQTIAEAIHHAHVHGVLHRDLKPSNVLIDGDDCPHVTDFGLAKMTSGNADLTLPGQILGSPQYLPPEQARGDASAVGPFSDVYSLGAILYCLLTGRPPFIAQAVSEVLSQVEKSEPIPPRLLNPAVPQDLETVCLKCLQKDPRDRYQTAQGLADELARFLRDEPITARPAGTLYRLARWSRREPTVAALVGGVLLVFATGSILVLGEWRQAEIHRLRADQRGEELRRISYDTAMKAAYEEWNDGNLEEVRTLLNDQRPKTHEKDLRGFEWRHLWRLCHAAAGTALPRRNQVAGAMAFSPDSQILAVYYWDNILRLWDRNRRNEVLMLTNISTLGGFCEEGRLYVTGTRQGDILFLRPDSGQVVRSLRGAGELVGLSTEARTGLTVTPGNILQAIDLPSGSVKFTKPGRVRRRSDYGWNALVALSSDGRFLAVAEPAEPASGLPARISAWDVQTQKKVASFTADRDVMCLLFSPVQRSLAVGWSDGHVSLWNFETGWSKDLYAAPRVELAGMTEPAPSFRLWKADGGPVLRDPRSQLPVLALAFSADGTTLATAGSDEEIRLWDLNTWTSRPGPTPRPTGIRWSLAFSPDGRWLASGGRSTQISMWELNNSPAAEMIRGLSVQTWGSVSFSSDSRLIAVACTNEAVKVLRVADLHPMVTLEAAGHVLGFSRNGEDLLTFKEGQLPQWRSLAGREPPRSIPTFGGELNHITAVDLSPDRRLAALGYDDGKIELLSVETGRSTRLEQHHAGEVFSIGFSPAGRSLSTNWNLSGINPYAVLSLAFSPRSDKLVSGGRDRAVVVWDVRTGQKLVGNDEDTHRGAVCAVAFSPNEDRIASGCGAFTIKLWDAAHLTATPLSRSYHRAPVQSLDFSPPDGSTLASGSRDATVKFWNGVKPRLDVGTLPQGSPVLRVLFSPDGNNLAVVTEDGRLRLLRAATLQEADAHEARQ